MNVGRDPLTQDGGAVEVQHPLSPLGVAVDPYALFGPHPSASQDEAFVKGLYNATLLRAGSAQEDRGPGAPRSWRPGRYCGP